jgi:hypothetical protein
MAALGALAKVWLSLAAYIMGRRLTGDGQKISMGTKG